MKFRTEISLLPFPLQISHQDQIMLMGSCFTENIGVHLAQNKFKILENPYGITFNPLSVMLQLREILDQHKYQNSHLDWVNQRFISFNHHSVFASATAQDLTQKINLNIEEAHQFLKTAKVLFISLGTAWVWQHTAKNTFVNNCHKVPAKQFNYRLAAANKMVVNFTETLKSLTQFNPNLQVVFTVSPVRHWRNGAVNNSRSKAVLINAVNQLSDDFTNVHYFPSYEIMMDDLRDYRFYEDDLLHPSKVAINYIWKKFGDAFFSDKTKEANLAIAKINAMQNHRHINTNPTELDKFNAKLKLRKDELKVKFGL